MRAAEETTADLDSMPDDSALAVLTNGRKSLDRTFEAIERVPCAGSYQLKTLVIVITTNFACCHIDLLHIALKHLRRDLAAVAGTMVRVIIESSQPERRQRIRFRGSKGESAAQKLFR